MIPVIDPATELVKKVADARTFFGTSMNRALIWICEVTWISASAADACWIVTERKRQNTGKKWMRVFMGILLYRLLHPLPNAFLILARERAARPCRELFDHLRLVPHM